MCGGRVRCSFWVFTMLMFGIGGLCVFITVRQKNLEQAYMYCTLVGPPVAQAEYSNPSGDKSVFLQGDIVSPGGVIGTCQVTAACLTSTCNETSPVPTRMRCWEESLDSNIPVCVQPPSYWHTYMYTAIGFGLAGVLFFIIAFSLTGWCKSRDNDEPEEYVKRGMASFPLSSRF